MAFTGKAQEYLETTIENDGFFPDLSLGVFQNVYRVPVEIAEEKVVEELSTAMLHVNIKLEEQVLDWTTAGNETLESVGQYLIQHYFMAVYNFAKANLLNDVETFTRRDKARQIDEDLDRTLQRLNARYQSSLKRLKGLPPNISAELI